MIQLEVEDYCHDCPNFKARTISIPSFKKEPVFVIKCETNYLCKKIHAHLEEKMKYTKGENSNESNAD